MTRETRQTNKKAGKGPTVKLPSLRTKQPIPSSSSGPLLEDTTCVTIKDNAVSFSKDIGAPKTGKGKAENFSKREENGFNIASTLNRNSLLKNFDLLQYGRKQDRGLCLKMMQNHFVNKSIKQLTAADYAGRFIRRITALTWHEKYPYALASASKFGDIMLISGSQHNSSTGNDIRFESKAELQGGGAGYSVTAMKFHQDEMNIVYRASIDCTVARVDLVHGETMKYYDTKDYNRWFCSLDVNFWNKFVIAGDNKGTAYKFSMDGKLLSTWRLHKTKIHHIEFSKRDPNLMVTSSLDKNEAVRIWDARFLKDSCKDTALKPLRSLPHASSLNCAKFSPVDGSRLLTSDQNDEIRVYQGPLWMDYLTIKHHHKQFQHITPIKADWHPVNDYIVIGRYPRKTESEKKLARAIEFFDSYSGELVDMIYPPLDEICSLNVFNPTGEYLATGMNSKLILWKPGVALDVAENLKRVGEDSSQKISATMRNVLRGRRAREYSPDSEDDDDDGATATKKKRSKTTSNNPTTTQVASKRTKSGRKKN